MSEIKQVCKVKRFFKVVAKIMSGNVATETKEVCMFFRKEYV